MTCAMRQLGLAALAAGVLTLALSSNASAQRKLSFAYDQPVTTAYGIATNLFTEKVKGLSGGKLSNNQFPGCQLGIETLIRTKRRDEYTHFPVYGPQTVHMPFGEVYVSVQTGVVNVAENGINVYEQNKHYEVAPVLNITQHEANNNCIWVSDKAWNSFSAEEKKWVQEAADEVSRREPAMAFKLESDSAAKLQKIGVKVNTKSDKSGFMKAAAPIQDQLATELGPHAVQILGLVRAVR